MTQRVLYAGDSPVGGAANYLLGVLGSMGAQVKHIPPQQKLTATTASRRYDAIVISDYASKQAPQSVQKILVEQVEQGCGLIMIGGWASFTGLWGQWRGTAIESVLPVRCLPRDDRRNVPGGALMVPKQRHAALRGLSWKSAPVLCGLNEVRPKTGQSQVLLSAAEIRHTRNLHHVRLGKEYPLLVASTLPGCRVLAFATDVAPHWCGGLVDWGARRMTLPVTRSIRVEVGAGYVRFLSGLIQWLAGGRNEQNQNTSR